MGSCYMPSAFRATGSLLTPPRQPLLSLSAFQAKSAASIRAPSRHGPVSVQAVARTDLEAWQILKLDSAHRTGKRSIKISELAHEVQLDRSDILVWFKDHDARTEEARENMRMVAEAAAAAATDRKAMLRESRDEKRSSHRAAQQEAAGSEKRRPNLSFAQRQAVPGTDFARKKLKKSVEATFKRVAENTLWPSDDMIASITDLHPEEPRVGIKAWFEERRRTEQASKTANREAKTARQQQQRSSQGLQ